MADHEDPPDDHVGSDRVTAVLQACTDLGLLLTGGQGCSVALLEPGAEHLRFVAASGEGADRVRGLRLPVSSGLAGWTVSSGQAITVDDVRADPRFARDVAEQTGYVPTSIVAVPLPLLDDAPDGDAAEGTGVLEVLDRRPDPSRDDLTVVSALAAVIGAALALERDAALARAAAASPAAALLTELGAAGPVAVSAAGAVLEALRDVHRAAAGESERGGRPGLV